LSKNLYKLPPVPAASQ